MWECPLGKEFRPDIVSNVEQWLRSDEQEF